MTSPAPGDTLRDSLEELFNDVYEQAITDMQYEPEGKLKIEQCVEAVIELFTDSNIDKLMALSDEQVTALTVMDGSNPKDVSTIGRQCFELAKSKVKIGELEREVHALTQQRAEDGERISGMERDAFLSPMVIMFEDDLHEQPGFRRWSPENEAIVRKNLIGVKGARITICYAPAIDRAQEAP